MDNTPIALDVVPFPDIQWSGDITELAALIVDHLVGTIPTGNSGGGPISGKTNGSEPVTDEGLWLNNNVWYNWSKQAGKYLPLPLVAGGLVKGVLRKTVLKPSTQNGDVILYLPDQDGATLATDADIQRLTGLRPTKTLPGGASVLLDFDQASRYVVNMSADMTVTFQGGVDGQTADLWLVTAPSTTPAWNLTWTGFYGISSGALSTTDSTHYSVTQVKISIVGDKVFVEFGSTWTVPIANDTSLPQVVSVDVDQDGHAITISTNKLLSGNDTLDVSKFYVSLNGVQNPITQATASGKKITLFTANPYPLGSIGSVSYGGSDAEDISGNVMTTFQPVAINVNPIKIQPITLTP